MSLSIREQLALLSADERAAYVESLSPEDLDLLVHNDWSVKGRPEQQLPPGDWFLWFIRAGRGFGKTETGAEATKELIMQLTSQVPNGAVRWAVGAPRHSDLIKTVFEGETGFRSILPPSMLIRGSWDASFTKGAVPELLLASGAIIQGYPSTVPDGPRGPQFHGAWCDEPGSYADAHLGLADDTFMSNLLFGLRLPPLPRLIVTGTPRNNRLIRELRKTANMVETHGRTSDNLHNLAQAFRDNIVARYLGTRLGRQELDAEILEGVGTMFQRSWFQEVNAAPWPAGTRVATVRYWDLASGEESDANPDPDWTAGARVSFDRSRRLYYIERIHRFRKPVGQRNLALAEIARQDGLPTMWIEKEPGNAGTSQIYSLGQELDRWDVNVKGNPVTGPKAVRWELVAGPAEQGRVYVKLDEDLPEDQQWLLSFYEEAEELNPDPKVSGPHDDMMDAVAGAFQVLKGGGGAEGHGRPENLPNIPKPSSHRDQGPVPGQIPRGAGLQRQGR